MEDGCRGRIRESYELTFLRSQIADTGRRPGSPSVRAVPLRDSAGFPPDFASPVSPGRGAGKATLSRLSRLRHFQLVHLTNDADRRVATCSGGMIKRLDLACGLINRPRLLILEEPTLAFWT